VSGKPLQSAEEALAHLKSVFEELESLPQTSDGNEEAAQKVQEACHDQYVKHTDADVRLWTAKVLLQGLRIFVPEPPLNQRQRKMALELFVDQVAQLGSSAPRSDEFRSQAISFLECFVTLRAAVLIFECRNEEKRLIAALLSSCLAAARADKEGSLEGLLAKLLADVLDEFDTMPQDVIKTLLWELTAPRRQRGTLSNAPQPAAGTPAQRVSELVRRVLSSLAHRNAVLPINEYLVSTLFCGPQAAGKASSTDRHEKEEAAETALATKLHLETNLNAIYELYTIDAALVSRVFPNLHEDLTSKDPLRRKLITQLVGRMLAYLPPSIRQSSSSSGSNGFLFQRYPLLLDRLIERVVDADEGVREASLEAAKQMLLAAVTTLNQEDRVRPLGRDSLAASPTTEAWLTVSQRLTERLGERVLDPSEVIRLKVIAVAFEVAMSAHRGLRLLAPLLPQILGRRIMDKKSDVRTASAEAMAKLYEQYALPTVLGSDEEEHQSGDAELAGLSWVARALLEAFLLFAQGKLGHTAFLEELIEKHILGCAHSGLTPSGHGRALQALCESCLSDDQARQGLELLLFRKRASHEALSRFLRLRIDRGAPVLAINRPREAGQSSLQLAPIVDEEDDSMAVTSLQELAKWSPSSEDRELTPELLLVHLRSLDACRDRSFWILLARLVLSSPTSEELKPDQLPGFLGELARMLRAQKLQELAPTLRRSFLCTWLLPAHIAGMLQRWQEDLQNPEQGPQSEGVSPQKRRRISRGDEPATASATAPRSGRSLEILAKYFPGSFSTAHVLALKEALAREGCFTALKVLSQLGKHTARLRCQAVALAVQQIDTEEFVEQLLNTLLKLASLDNFSSISALCRSAVSSLALLSSPEPGAAVDQMLDWVEEQGEKAQELRRGPPLLALEVASACLEAVLSDRLGRGACPEATVYHARERKWVELAAAAHPPEATLQSLPPKEALAQLSAALSLTLACGDSEGAASLLASARAALGLPAALLELATSTLKPLRRGGPELTNSLLTALATLVSRGFSAAETSGNSEESVAAADRLLKGFLKLQKPVQTMERIGDRLRLSVTLPCLLALAPLKRHRESGEKLLHATMQKALRDAAVSEEPYLDYAVACFIHFLSRLEPFKEECSQALTKYPLSSKVAEVFCEGLLKADSMKSVELAVVALRVCDRVRYFQDKDTLDSEAIHKASSVLRHIVEKHSPGLGQHGSALLQLPQRASMPAALFSLREDLVHQQAVPLPAPTSRASSGFRAAAAPIADQVTSVARPMGSSARSPPVAGQQSSASARGKARRA